MSSESIPEGRGGFRAGDRVRNRYGRREEGVIAYLPAGGGLAVEWDEKPGEEYLTYPPSLVNLSAASRLAAPEGTR